MDRDAYLYIYNEVFVKNWNQYIKKLKAGSYLIRSKWLPEESEPTNGVSLENLSPEEKLKIATKFKESTERRIGKQGRYFQKLVNYFDRERELIICHNNKFYAYEIETKFADHISIYLIEESEITSILNHLYLRIRKGNRVVWRQRLFRDFETDD